MTDITQGITTAKLVDDLRAIGLERGDLVYVHSSMKRVGWIQEGIDGLLTAFLEVLGAEGTLAVPTHTYTGSKSERGYNPAITASKVGQFTECVLRDPRAYRSGHPTHSSAAIGAKAKELTENHNLHDPFAYDSPLHRAYRMGAKVLLIGVTHNSNTAIHLAEAMSGVGYTSIPLTEGDTAALIEDEHGAAVKVEQTEFPACSSNFKLMEALYRYHGIGGFGYIGNAFTHILDMKPMIDYTVGLINEKPDFLLCHWRECPVCSRRRAFIANRQGSAST